MWPRCAWSLWARSRCCNWIWPWRRPIIDLLLGGEGKDGPLRELTDIEEAILGSVVEIICRELTAAWQPVGLSFNFERRQMQTQVARIMSVNEKTLCLSFEIRMPHSSGLLNLAFPAVVANTILRRLTSDWGRSRRHAAEIQGADGSLGRPHPLWRRSAAAPGAPAGGRGRRPSAGHGHSALTCRRTRFPNGAWAGRFYRAREAVRQGLHRAARIDSRIERTEP